MSDRDDRRNDKEIWPVHVVKRGVIEAAVWERQDKDGATRFQVSLSRSYRTREGKWARTATFDRRDLPAVLECTEQAQSWVHARERQLTQRKADAESKGRTRDGAAREPTAADPEAKALLRQLIETLAQKNNRGMPR